MAKKSRAQRRYEYRQKKIRWAKEELRRHIRFLNSPEGQRRMKLFWKALGNRLVYGIDIAKLPPDEKSSMVISSLRHSLKVHLSKINLLHMIRRVNVAKKSKKRRSYSPRYL